MSVAEALPEGQEPAPPCLDCGTIGGSAKGKRTKGRCRRCYDRHRIALAEGDDEPLEIVEPGRWVRLRQGGPLVYVRDPVPVADADAVATAC